MSQENVELVYRVLDAFNRRDLDAVLALMHGDVEFGSRLAAMEGGYNGHEGIRRWWQTILDASPDRTVAIVEVRDLGEVSSHWDTLAVMARSVTFRTRRPSGPLPGGSGKKAVWWGVFPTKAEALEAAGLRE